MGKVKQASMLANMLMLLAGRGIVERQLETGEISEDSS
jgi:hypothetical protein